MRNTPPSSLQLLLDVHSPYDYNACMDALERGLDLSVEEIRNTDLDDLAGSWIPDPEFDRVISEMERIDEDLWK